MYEEQNASPDQFNKQIIREHRHKELHVWVLAGSSGSIIPMRRFLATLPQGLPVSFVIALNISSENCLFLPKLFNCIKGYEVFLLKPHQLIQGQKIIIVPADVMIHLLPDNRIMVKQLSEQYSAIWTIDQTIRTVARNYRQNSGAIIFSGIGSEGVEGCNDMLVKGGKIWVQDSTSCRYTSMPAYINKMCDVSFCATPEMMAKRLAGTLNVSQDNNQNDQPVSLSFLQ